MLAAIMMFSGLLGFQDAAPVGSAPTPATIQAPAAASAPQAPAARPRRICEQRALTGRRIEQRVCYTPEQYAEMVAIHRKQAEEIVSRGIIQDDRRAEGGIPR